MNGTGYYVILKISPRQKGKPYGRWLLKIFLSSLHSWWKELQCQRKFQRSFDLFWGFNRDLKFWDFTLNFEKLPAVAG